MGDSTRSTDVRSKRGAPAAVDAMAAVPVLFWWLNPAVKTARFRSQTGYGKRKVMDFHMVRRSKTSSHAWYKCGIVGWMI